MQTTVLTLDRGSARNVLRCSVAAQACGLAWIHLAALRSSAPTLGPIDLAAWSVGLVSLLLLTKLIPARDQRLPSRASQRWLAATVALLASLGEILDAGLAASSRTDWLALARWFECTTAAVAPWVWVALWHATAGGDDDAVGNERWTRRFLQGSLAVTLVAHGAQALSRDTDAIRLLLSLAGHWPGLHGPGPVASGLRIIGSAHLLAATLLLFFPRRAFIYLLVAGWGGGGMLAPLLAGGWPAAAQSLRQAALVGVPLALALGSAKRRRPESETCSTLEGGPRHSRVAARAASIAAHALACGLALLLVGRVAAIRGLVQPIRIASGSMAPFLLGPHAVFACADCGFRLACEPESSDTGRPMVCPNCGHRQDPAAGPLVAGERVVLDRTAGHLCPPRRWETVAYRSDAVPQRWETKRVVGLPGERLEIRGGDIYADGRILRKTLAELRQVALLVHDNTCTPQSTDFPARWLPEHDNLHDPRPWISYRHWPCYDTPIPRGSEAPPVDDDPYNAALSRPVFPVRDLLLSCRLTLHGQGRLWWRYDGPAGRYELGVDYPAGSWTLFGADKILDSSARHLAFPPPAHGCWHFAVYDEQIVLAVNDVELVTYAFSARPRRPAPTDSRVAAGDSGREAPRNWAGLPTRPLAIAAEGIEIEFEQLRVFRDLFYVNPDGLPLPWTATARLGPREFFVLGDNVPVALDSRHHGPLHGRRILGTVIRPPYR